MPNPLGWGPREFGGASSASQLPGTSLLWRKFEIREPYLETPSLSALWV